MFLNKKRLLLTLYRLEEGQQEIMARLDALEGKTADGPAHTLPKQGNPPDQWIMDGIEAILSYRRDKEGKA